MSRIKLDQGFEFGTRSDAFEPGGPSRSGRPLNRGERKVRRDLWGYCRRAPLCGAWSHGWRRALRTSWHGWSRALRTEMFV